MPDWAWAVIISSVGALAGTITLMITLGIIVFKAGHWKADIEGQIREVRKDIEGQIREVRKDIGSILQVMSDHFPFHPYIVMDRPSRLEERIAEDLKVESWAIEESVKLKEKVKGQSPLEISKFVENYVFTSLSKEMSNRIIEYSYEYKISDVSVRMVLISALRKSLISET